MTTIEKPRKSAFSEADRVKMEAKKAKAKKKVKKKTKTKGKTKKADEKPKKDGVISLLDRRNKIRERYDRPVLIFESDEEKVPRPPTRFVRFNRMLGGGLKAGAIIELFGFEDSGKTSTAAAFAADVQQASPPGKRTVVFCNFEGPQPYRWWRTLGLDTTEEGDHPAFVQLRPKTLEEGMADVYDLCESGEVCCVVIDSVYAAAAKGSAKVMENWRDPKKGGGTGGGLSVEARQWGIAWTALKGSFQDHDIVVIAVNQMRELIETSGPPRKGWMSKPTTTPRGHALKFYAWVRIEMQGRVLVDEDGGLRKDVDGKRVRMRIIKNKTSDDARGIVDYDLIRGFGFDLVGDLISCATEAGAINAKGGGFYEIGTKRIRGKLALREWVEGSQRVQAVLKQYVERWMAKKPLEELSMTDEESASDAEVAAQEEGEEE